MARVGGDGSTSRQQPPRNTKKKSTGSKSKKAALRKDKEIDTLDPTLESEDEEQTAEHTTAPWPRPDNTPITGFKLTAIPDMTSTALQRSSDYINHKIGDPWGRHYSICYNGLLRVKMVPTKFVCGQTLQRMGIADDVVEMLGKIGFGTFATRTYPLYPELVRQFLASAELQFTDDRHPIASEGKLSYFSSGILYEISIRDLCGLYGFDRTRERCAFPTTTEDFPHFHMLWNVIGSGPCHSRSNKLTLIRNHVVRVMAKILGNTLFAKEETGSLRFDELMLIHFGLPSFVQAVYSAPTPSVLDTNLGAVFASILVQKKFRGLKNVQSRTESVGSLLTPIFRFHQIDLTKTSCVDKLDFINEDYLKSSSILKPGFRYTFYDRQGNACCCKLPLPALTALTSLENLEFLPAPEHLCEVPSTSRTARRRGSSSRATDAPPHLEDTTVPDHYPHQSAFPSHDTMDQLLPDYTGEYDLPPLPADVSDEDRWRWMVESQRKNNTMLQRIWGALAKLQCPRPPSCFRAGETSGTAAETHDAPTFDPDVAGRGTAEDDDTTEHVRRPRRRRVLGESHSGTSSSDI